MIVIIDYGIGNIHSIANMLKKVGARAIISSDPQEIIRAEKLILPGVGAFDAGMRNLNESGLIPLLNEEVLEKKKPVIGLCLGMQLMAKGSEEGAQSGLNWINAEVVKFKFQDDNNELKIPHMSWNSIEIMQQHALFEDIGPAPRFYFVHSYHLICHDAETVLAKTDYGYKFDSVICRNNILGVQFHPEKSHKYGMRLLRNFAERI